MFVVPPFLGTDDAWYSYVPLVVVEPAVLLADRATLHGALLFDRTARRNDARDICFPDDLVEFAAVPTLAVSATWDASAVLSVEAAWRASPDLPDHLAAPGQALQAGPPDPAFCDAIDQIIATTYGVAEANISKALACARPSMFPMIDQYLRRGLRGSVRSDADWADRDCFGFWMNRFRRLLLATKSQLNGIGAPPGLAYSPTEKLDRLLWLGHFGAAFYRLPTPWTVVENLPPLHILSGAWQVNAYARTHARLVAPSVALGTARGVVSFDTLDARQRGAVLELMQAANAQAGALWGQP